MNTKHEEKSMFSKFTFRGEGGGLIKKINGLHFLLTLNFGRSPLHSNKLNWTST